MELDNIIEEIDDLCSTVFTVESVFEDGISLTYDDYTINIYTTREIDLGWKSPSGEYYILATIPYTLGSSGSVTLDECLDELIPKAKESVFEMFAT